MANVSLSVTKIETINVIIPPIEKQLELIYLMEKCEILRSTLSKSTNDTEQMIMSALSEAFKIKEKGKAN